MMRRYKIDRNFFNDRISGYIFVLKEIVKHISRVDRELTLLENRVAVS